MVAMITTAEAMLNAYTSHPGGAKEWVVSESVLLELQTRTRRTLRVNDETGDWEVFGLPLFCDPLLPAGSWELVDSE